MHSTGLRLPTPDFKVAHGFHSRDVTLSCELSVEASHFQQLCRCFPISVEPVHSLVTCILQQEKFSSLGHDPNLGYNDYTGCATTTSTAPLPTTTGAPPPPAPTPTLLHYYHHHHQHHHYYCCCCCCCCCYPYCYC